MDQSTDWIKNITESLSKMTMNQSVNKLVSSISNLDIDEENIKGLEKAIDDLKKKVKERNKPKTITISGKDHSIIKKFCIELNLNIGEWTSKVLLSEIRKHDCFIVDDKDIEIEKEILNKYSKLNGVLYKLTKIVTDHQFVLRGYSFVDGLPIYEYLGPLNMINKYNSRNHLHPRFEENVILIPVNPNEISKSIKHSDVEIFYQDVERMSSEV
jgi:hypothetical protein